MGGTDSTEKDGAAKIRKKPGRVPTSCAECRRLKLRCDKGVPCEKCVSRGCGSICPNGSLIHGKGNRLILANTRELHDRIDFLSSRIRDLESALRTAHQSVSDQSHPLLQKDVLQPDFPHNVNSLVEPMPTSINNSSSAVSAPLGQSLVHPQSQSTGAEENFVDAFGTLILDAGDRYTYHGSTARSELLIPAFGERRPRKFIATSRLSEQIINASTSGLAPCNSSITREAFALIPPMSEALRLCEIYQEYGKIMYTSVPLVELLDDILSTVYRGSYENFTNHDSLALLFVVFALGAHFDSKRQSYSVESQEFYHIARAALRLSSQASLTSIQARIHVAQYLEYSDWESAGSHDTWMYIGHAVRLAQSAGLHLNSARWNLSDSNIHHRSRLFWQLFHLDTWASFHLGRPSTMSPSCIDWPSPSEANDIIARHDIPESFNAWNWRYSALLQSVVANTFGPKQPSYVAVLSMDRQIRDFPVHPTWSPVCEGSPSTELSMQWWIMLSSKESTLLSLHRAYFAKALEDMPNQLMRHRYIPSVLSVHRSAWRLMRGLKMVWSQAVHVMSRTSLAWSQALSATIAMCLLITRAPTSEFAQSAMTELDDVLDLFKTAMARPAAHLLDSIQRLHNKARDAVNRRSEGVENALSNTELDCWAGKTYMLSKDGPPHLSMQSRQSQSVTMLTAVGADYWSDGMHPTLEQDMRNFEARSPSFECFFDLPTPGTPQPQPHLQPPEVQTSDPHLYTSDGYHGFQPYPRHSAFLQTAPALDPTWQTLAEQLGF